MMRTYLATVLSCSFLLVACKGEKVVQIDPSTKAALDDCEKKRQALADLNKTLSDENAKLMRKEEQGEIVIALEGNLMTVKPPKPGQAQPAINDEEARKAAMEFQNLVQKSRGAITKCYEQALKKNAASTGKSVMLSVSASFSKAGAYQSANFSPSLGDTFDQCMRSVASSWKLAENSPAMTFRAQVELTPST